MRRILRLAFFTLAAAATAAPAAAQPPAPISPWNFGTTVNVFTGAAHDAARTTAVFGGAFGWELTPAIGFEASGQWLDRGVASNTFAADLTMQVGFTHPQTVVPFAEAGIGFYRASFGSGATDIPAFYQRRMMGPAGPIGVGRQTFTDPAFVLGGGANVFLTRHVAIRPDVSAAFVRRSGAGHTVTTFAVHVAYHFEPHPLFSRR
jgi:hypothetical protein